MPAEELNTLGFELRAGYQAWLAQWCLPAAAEDEMLAALQADAAALIAGIQEWLALGEWLTAGFFPALGEQPAAEAQPAAPRSSASAPATAFSAAGSFASAPAIPLTPAPGEARPVTRPAAPSSAPPPGTPSPEVPSSPLSRPSRSSSGGLQDLARLLAATPYEMPPADSREQESERGQPPSPPADSSGSLTSSFEPQGKAAVHSAGEKPATAPAHRPFEEPLPPQAVEKTIPARATPAPAGGQSWGPQSTPSSLPPSWPGEDAAPRQVVLPPTAAENASVGSFPAPPGPAWGAAPEDPTPPGRGERPLHLSPPDGLVAGDELAFPATPPVSRGSPAPLGRAAGSLPPEGIPAEEITARPPFPGEMQPSGLAEPLSAVDLRRLGQQLSAGLPGGGETNLSSPAAATLASPPWYRILQSLSGGRLPARWPGAAAQGSVAPSPDETGASAGRGPTPAPEMPEMIRQVGETSTASTPASPSFSPWDVQELLDALKREAWREYERFYGPVK